MLRTLVLISCSALMVLSQPLIRVAPVPSDPFELAGGPTQVADTPQKRADAMKLLNSARDLYAVPHPFDLKVSFTSSGQTQYEGPGQWEELSESPQNYRWSYTVGGFSQVRIFRDGVAYAGQNSTLMPLRAQQVHGVLRTPIHGMPQQAMIRTADVAWNGEAIRCVLLSGGGNSPQMEQGRRWVETEYCVNTQTGLLRIYSEAPGIYSVYDYSNAVQFKGKTLPGKITVAEAGATVLEMRVDSITDPGNIDPGLLTPGPEMKGQGAATLIGAPMRFPTFAPGPVVVDGFTQHPVIVHGVLNPNGTIADAVALQTSNSTLGNAASNVVKKLHLRTVIPPGSAGAQREVFVNVRLATPSN